MSARDYSENHALLQPLEGCRCFLSLAANTAKLRIDKNQKGGDYIWIDPPWTLTRHGRIVASSVSYPDHQARDYQKLHDEWCSQFNDVFESQIHAIQATVEGSLKVDIENGFSFEAPVDDLQSDDKDDWYDHWYVSIGNQSCEQGLTEKSSTPE